MNYGPNDLEDRLINFSVSIVELTKELSNDQVGTHLGRQLIRCGTSVSLNYGEARSAESRKDFIHKMKIVLKELRECFVCLKIIYRTKLFAKEGNIMQAISENNELISIFVKSINTAQNKTLNQK